MRIGLRRLKVESNLKPRLKLRIIRMSEKAGANELAFPGEKEQENQARVRWTWKPSDD
jgi:hypothetical protein